MDVANDVRLAARRFGFRRKTQTHPMDDIDSEEVAVAAIAYAFGEMAALPSQEDQARLADALTRQYGRSGTEARELLVLARWLMTQCGGPDAAVDRGCRRLRALSGDDGVMPLVTVIKQATGGQDLTPAQSDALAEIKSRFRLS